MKNIFSATKNIFSETKKIFSVTENIFSETKKIFSVTENIFSETKKIFSATKKIFSEMKKIFSETKKIFSETKTIFSGEPESVMIPAQYLELVVFAADEPTVSEWIQLDQCTDQQGQSIQSPNNLHDEGDDGPGFSEDGVYRNDLDPSFSLEFCPGTDCVVH